MKFRRDASWDVRLRLEKRLAVEDRFSDLGSYSKHLARLWCVYAAAEQAWGADLGEMLDDFPARQTARLLAEDFEALGGIASGPWAPIPPAHDEIDALGGFTSKHGASCLASYGCEVKPMWRRFGAAAHCPTPDSQARAAAAARKTFIALEDWLCGDHA